MTPADGDGLVMSNRALADLGLDDATWADFAACWDVLCAPPPPELAEAHIHAAAALAEKASHPRLPNSGRSLAKAAVISAAAFVGTTGLAAADVLPPAAVHVVETVANTVRDAVDPIPPELSTPAPAPEPKPAVRAVSPASDDAHATSTTAAPDSPTTTVAVDASSSGPASTTTTVTSVVGEVTSTTAVVDDVPSTDPTGTDSGSGSTTTTTTVPDDGTAVAAGTGSTTTTTPGSTTTTEPSSTTTTTEPPTTTP